MADLSASAFTELVSGRRGHFGMESGYHSALWLNLDALFAAPDRVRPFVSALTDSLRPYQANVICGPLLGGAFLAQRIAEAIGAEFWYTQPVPPTEPTGLYRARYELLAAFAGRLTHPRSERSSRSARSVRCTSQSRMSLSRLSLAASSKCGCRASARTVRRECHWRTSALRETTPALHRGRHRTRTATVTACTSFGAWSASAYCSANNAPGRGATSRSIHERSGTRRCEADRERIARRDHRKNVIAGATPSGHAVGKTLQLDAVPVNRRLVVRPVHDVDRHTFAPGQFEHRARHRHRVCIGLVRRPAKDERVADMPITSDDM